jgi:YD repeat-containing protein
VLRPEQLVLGRADLTTDADARGVVREVAYHGYDSMVRVELTDGTRVRVRVPGGTAPPAEGAAVTVGVTGQARVYPTVMVPAAIEPATFRV